MTVQLLTPYTDCESSYMTVQLLTPYTDCESSYMTVQPSTSTLTPRPQTPTPKILCEQYMFLIVLIMWISLNFVVIFECDSVSPQLTRSQYNFQFCK